MILPVLSVMGFQPVALPTVVLSTHTGGFGTPARLDGCAYGEAALEHYRELGLSFDCIYTGYLGGEEQAALAEKAFDLWPSAYKVVDPVMGDNGKAYSTVTPAFIDRMRQLCRRADLILPNATEAALLLERFQNGAYPLAVVSMDNCSHNGEKLQTSVMTVAKAWLEKGFVGQDFIDYLSDETKITFPWSMIDKITPRPHKIVEESLEKDGIEGMTPIVTSKNTFIAAFVNAERPQYLVVEDKFPNGRPALEKAGVYMTDRETVNKTERMKVTTCLNPLHTAMSVYGCMLGYDLICAEMKDEDIVALIKRLGYVEGLPVVVDPKILNPKAFIDEVIEQRLPNPFMPDTPQRIATDTSQKVGIRFGETIKSYVAEGRDLNSLVSIPLAIAGWLRYLLAIDDNGNAFEVSADPLKDELQAKLSGIEFGKPETVTDQLDGILSNASIFGSDLTKTVLADKIKAYFKAEIAGAGAVRKTLHEAVNG